MQPFWSVFRFLKLAIGVVALLPAAALGGISSDEFPGDSSWYFHADLQEMRNGDGGRALHDWLDREVFEDLRDELGIDLAREAHRVTAFSGEESGVALVLEGPLEERSKDKILALASDAQQFESHRHKGRDYHFVRGEFESESGNIEIDNLDDGAYFSFALDDKLLMTSTEEQMRELLEQKGRIRGQRSHSNAILVLSAERSLVQAGVQTGELSTDDGDGWDSSLLRNAEQVALLVADARGMLAIEAQMIAVSREKAEALGNIARGLLALQAFSDDMDPELREVLNNTTIDVEDSVLKLTLALDPDVVIAQLDE